MSRHPNFSRARLAKNQGNHSLSGNAGGGDDADVAALVACTGGLARVKTHRFERLAERGDGLQVAANDDVFAVGDAALDAACVCCAGG